MGDESTRKNQNENHLYCVATVNDYINNSTCGTRSRGEKKSYIQVFIVLHDDASHVNMTRDTFYSN